MADGIISYSQISNKSPVHYNLALGSQKNEFSLCIRNRNWHNPARAKIVVGPWPKEDSPSQTCHIYTECLLLNGRSGSGIVIWQNNWYRDTAKVRPEQATVYQGEVKAVQNSCTNGIVHENRKRRVSHMA